MDLDDILHGSKRLRTMTLTVDQNLYDFLTGHPVRRLYQWRAFRSPLRSSLSECEIKD
jgi:hypothetical protein